MSLGTVSFDLKSRPMPPGHQESQKSSETPQHQPGQGQGPQQKDQGIQPLAGEQLTSLTANYSVAPGPVWLEFVNKAAVTVSAATPVRGDLPLQGSAFLLRFLDRPIMAAVLTPHDDDQRPRFGSESHEPHPPDFHWWPKFSHRPIEEATGMAEAQEQEEQRVEQMAEKAKKDEEEKKKQSEQEQQEQQQQQSGQEHEQSQKQQQQKPQPKQAIGRAAVPPGRIDEWVATTGMSHEGFPGFPQPISDDTALPATAGINRVEVDQTTDPPEVAVYMVGSGSVPAGSRWIFFTLQGV